MATAGQKNTRPPAEVPVDTGKHMRACLRCKLLKTVEQFHERGCENCPRLGMEGEKSRVMKCTTTNFNGVISVFDPNSSWAAKWLRLEKLAPGCYALSVSEKLPQDILDTLED